MKRLVVVPILVLTVALVAPGTAYAGENEQGQVVMGGTYTLESGEVLEGDLVVFGGSVELEEDSRVEGDVLIFGGSAEINGEIQGDLGVLGGNAELGPTAVIGDSVVSLGGNVHRAPGAEIGGDTVTADGFYLPLEFELPNFPDFVRSRPFPFTRGGFTPFFSPVSSLLWLVFRSLFVAALAVLVVLFWPNAATRTGDAAVSQPIIAGGLGCLTLIVVPILCVLFVITLIGIPVSLLLVVGLIVALLFGWIAIGVEVGKRLAAGFGWDIQPAASAGLGTLIVSLVVLGIGLIPCVGWLAPLLVGAAGLGAVLLTRFGSREYELAPAAAELPPPESSAKSPAKKSSSKKSSSKKSSSEKSSTKKK